MRAPWAVDEFDNAAGILVGRPDCWSSYSGPWRNCVDLQVRWLKRGIVRLAEEVLLGVLARRVDGEDVEEGAIRVGSQAPGQIQPR